MRGKDLLFQQHRNVFVDYFNVYGHILVVWQRNYDMNLTNTLFLPSYNLYRDMDGSRESLWRVRRA